MLAPTLTLSHQNSESSALTMDSLDLIHQALPDLPLSQSAIIDFPVLPTQVYSFPEHTNGNVVLFCKIQLQDE